MLCTISHSTHAVSTYPVYEAWGGPGEAVFIDYEYEPMEFHGRGVGCGGPPPRHDPPPYSEVAMEGHLSLMRGTSPTKTEGTLDTSVDSGDRSTLQCDESIQSSAMLPLDMQRAELSRSTMELLAEGPQSMEHNSTFQSTGEASCSNGPSYTTLLEASRHSVVFPSRPSTFPRSQSLGSAPLYHPSETPTPPMLTRQQSYPRVMWQPLPRDMELGYGHYPQQSTSPVVFPPRPGLSTPPIHRTSLPQLRPAWVRPPLSLTPSIPPGALDQGGNEPVLQSSLVHSVGSPPPRLPPIEQQELQLPQQQQEQGKRQRRRRRKKRGHTWHGEGLPKPVTAPTESSLVVDT